MSANNSEYIPDPENSKASEASRKAWETARHEAAQKVHARTLTILACRRKVVLDNSISRDARLLFVWLLDCSLWKEVNTSDGAIAISGIELCKNLGCCLEALTRWKKELLWPRYIWISDVRRRGHWNSHLFHIQDLDPQEQWLAQKTVDGILKADAPDRPAPAPFKKRPLGDARRPIYLVDGNGNLEALDSEGAASAKPNGPLYQTERPAPSNGERPLYQTERPAPSNGDGPLYQTGSARSTKQSGPLCQTGTGGSAEQSAPLHQTGILRETQASNESLETCTNAINRLENRAGAAEGGTGGEKPPRAARRAPESENDFMALCMDVFGKPEMINGGPTGEGNGGLWRTLYRQNSGKALRVLLETRAVKKDTPHILKSTWAAYAMDLWKNDRVGA